MKRGKCTNYGDCDEAGKVFEVEDGLPFECHECHGKLQEVDANGKPIKSSKMKKRKKRGGLYPKILFIIAGIIIAGIIVALIFIFKGEEKTPETMVIPESVETPDSIADKTARNDTLVIKVEGMDGKQEDSLTVTNKEPQEEKTVTPAIKEVTKTSPSSTPYQSNSSKESSKSITSKNLGYGTWSGSLQNGLPHGMGTMTYSSSHIIDSRDSKGRVAQPGEYIVGEWDKGHLVQGRWFKNDGTKEAVIIGKAG